ncbi:MAG TPA: hypothetical protein VFK94_04895 [Patescibacteria group bacterium]|nr:hypothetical protein [Patescibacteria group bacterium]
MRRWTVKWRNPEGKLSKKHFEGKSPAEAVQFAKQLKKQGLSPNVFSSNHAFPPTKDQEEKRRPGMMWCPYCIKWRNFKMMAIKRSTYTSEAFMRCPICTISVNDYYVRKYNGFLEHMTEAEVIKKLMKYEGIHV